MNRNIVALLTEAADARIATPIYIERNQLRDKLMTPSVTMPHPWLGGWWRLQDIVDNELIFNFSAIRTAHERKTDFLMNFRFETLVVMDRVKFGTFIPTHSSAPV